MTGPIDVLIVEDFLALAECLRITLERRGWVARVAPCLARAREMIPARTPRTVLLDLNLPDGDGAGLIPEAKAAGCRVVVCSAQSESRPAGPLAGADAVYVKTRFTLDELAAELLPPRPREGGA